MTGLQWKCKQRYRDEGETASASKTATTTTTSSTSKTVTTTTTTFSAILHSVSIWQEKKENKDWKEDKEEERLYVKRKKTERERREMKWNEVR